VQAPNANAYAERWIRTVRTQCLNWLLIVGRGHWEQSCGSTPPTTTPTVHTGRSDWNRRLHPPISESSATASQAGCIGATYSAGSSTNTTNELHERICGPYAVEQVAEDGHVGFAAAGPAFDGVDCAAGAAGSGIATIGSPRTTMPPRSWAASWQ
jgi:hypothetical protein